MRWLAFVFALGLLGCVREARIHVSGDQIAAMKERPVCGVTTSEGAFSGMHMHVVGIENDDGTTKSFKPHINLDSAVHQASEKGASIVVRQTDYSTTSNIAQTGTLIGIVILGGVSQVLSVGAIVTTQDLIKTPFDQAWYRSTFAFAAGVAAVTVTAGIFWMASRLAFLGRTDLGEGKLR